MSEYRSGAGFALLAAVLFPGSALPTAARADCPAPSIVAPDADTTLAAARPALRWLPVPGATGYRVRLLSREPEGRVNAAIDTLTAAPAFEPPQPLTDRNAIVRVSITPRCGSATGPEASLRFFIDTRAGCPAVAGPVVEQGTVGSTLRWASVEDAQRYEVLAYSVKDGSLLDRAETQQLSLMLPGSGAASAVAAVRARCREGYGPFAFVTY